MEGMLGGDAVRVVWLYGDEEGPTKLVSSGTSIKLS